MGHPHKILLAGNPDAVITARDRMRQLILARGGFEPPYPLDMEPFEVLRDLIREGAFPDIGGPPQVAKVYRHGNSQPFAVRWSMPTAASDLTILGRPLFKGEKTQVHIVDPDAIEFRSAKTLAKRAKRAERACAPISRPTEDGSD